MDHAANRASMSHQMATSNRGVIVATAQRGHRAYPPGNAGLNGSNAYEEPAEFMAGSHGDVGINDPDDAFMYGCPDGGRSDE